ncbi:MAG: hypothetical protein LBG09_03625 [Puniceicoccales bacterium]|jgi:pullulanase/glycogen debranching enzyme|nr:hypothetical protein [Puniceicoccales bacterium]
MEGVEVLGAMWLDSGSGLLFFCKNIAADSLGRDFGHLFLNGEAQEVQFSFAEPLEIAATNGYFEDNGEIIFLPSENVKKRSKNDDFYLAGDLNQWLSNGLDPKWKLGPKIVQKHPRLAWSIVKNELPKCFQFKLVSQKWEWQPLPRFHCNGVATASGFENFEYSAEKTGRHVIKFSSKGNHFRLGDSAQFLYDGRRIGIDDRYLLFSLFFDGKLGAWVDRNRTHFALFAPRILTAEILWKRDLVGEYQRQPMAPKTNGIWETSLDGDFTNYYYLFHIQRREKGAIIAQDVADPYAKALVSKNGPGIITKIPAVTRHFRAPPKENLIVYEGHVRDLIADVPTLSPAEKLGFSGLEKFLENGYFRDLGVNAVELQPVQEFDNDRREDYHWGYMPVNYFSPASAYGSNPEKAAQIKEFRALVEAFHRQNIAVILDVVYNHVGEPNHLYAIDPSYYFRTNGDGFLLNFSGCGNDLFTENLMVRRLIADSLEHFVRCYDVDGFRFDLAELVGLDLLDEIGERLRNIKPSIIMIAEPWSFRRYVGHDLKKTNLLGWNDEFREFIREYVCGRGNGEGLRYFMEGSLKFRSKFPAQSVNYLFSHDDFCWIDRLTTNGGSDGFIPTFTDIRRTHIALAILLLSLGVPMLGAGLELLHSKRGVANTYRRGDLNALSYGRQREYFLTYRYVQRLIQLRKNSPLFCLEGGPSSEYIRVFPAGEQHSALAVLFNATGECGPERILFAANPHFDWAHFSVEGLVGDNFKQIADTLSFSGENRAAYDWGGSGLVLPPLSCGIWANYCKDFK